MIWPAISGSYQPYETAGQRYLMTSIIGHAKELAQMPMTIKEEEMGGGISLHPPYAPTLQNKQSGRGGAHRGGQGTPGTHDDPLPKGS